MYTVHHLCRQRGGLGTIAGARECCVTVQCRDRHDGALIGAAGISYSTGIVLYSSFVARIAAATPYPALKTRAEL